MDKKDERVTESCGCVFCDLELEPRIVGGEPMHESFEEFWVIPCTRQPTPSLTPEMK